jgi:hypothetical protein
MTAARLARMPFRVDPRGMRVCQQPAFPRRVFRDSRARCLSSRDAALFVVRRVGQLVAHDEREGYRPRMAAVGTADRQDACVIDDQRTARRCARMLAFGTQRREGVWHLGHDFYQPHVKPNSTNGLQTLSCTKIYDDSNARLLCAWKIGDYAVELRAGAIFPTSVRIVCRPDVSSLCLNGSE